MALQINNLSELNPDRVQELLALFSQWVKERHPEVELSRGVFHDLVLYFNSALNAAVQENVNRVRQSSSLLAISQNPEIADDDIVDRVLSNFNLTRNSGAVATGEALVIVNKPINTPIIAGVTLAANGVTFLPARAFVGVAPGSPANFDGARSMVPVGDGTYAFKITVVATTAGVAGNISRGVKLTPAVAPTNVASIIAATDFTGGTNAATNAEYISKLADGLTAKTIGGRKAFAALIRSQPDFQNIAHLSVVGFGDAEQKRDQHGLFPVSGGGRVDIYAQTNTTAQKTEQLLTALYIRPAIEGDLTAGTVWQLTLDKDTAPGFYNIARVAKINDDQNSGYTVTMQTRGYNLAGSDYAPDIQTLQESEFTRYKTLTIQFVDTDKQSTGLTARQSTAVYSVTTVGMPLIGQLQDFLNGREIRCRTADVLVKAAVPCMTTIGFKVQRAANEVNPDIAAIKTEIVNAVSKIGFSGQLSASVISSAAHKYLNGQQSISDMDIFGKILRPDNTVVYLRDPARIEVPDDPDNLVSAKTVVFLTSEDDIEIDIDVISGFGD
jgi:hypothetical protein